MATPAPYASGARTANFDGLIYANGQNLLPAAEGDLSTINSNTQQSPIPVGANAAAIAVVQFTVQGSISASTCYVVMQGDMGDGVWIDLAWCSFTGTAQGAANKGVFILSAGVAGANSFQQTRAAGTAPSPANSSNQCPLLGRIRFVGKATITATGQSSSSQGGVPPWVTPGVLVQIRVKQLGLR